MENIVLHVYYQCKPGMAAPFVQALKDSGVQQQVQAEDGCLQYDYHISCELPETVVLLEKWRDAAALAQHQAQPHMEEIRRLKAIYADNMKLERYE